MAASRAGPIFICAGEPSGDLYAALYVEKLKRSQPDHEFFGVGGDRMAGAGVNILHDPAELGSFGLFSAVNALPGHIHALHAIGKALARIRPVLFIAVAYPGINLFLLPRARRMGCGVQYLLPPQAWAWGRFRVNLIARWVDRVITVFPFEYDFYRKQGITAEYWENPLHGILKHFKRTDATPRIGFMPGSRRREIQRNLPVIASYLDYLHAGNGALRFVLILHGREALAGDRRSARIVRDLERRYPDRFTVHTDERYAVMKNCDFLITCSGTASLEAAFLHVPQCFFNRCSWFDYTFMRPFVSIKEYNLANLYFGANLVPSRVTFSGPALEHFLHSIDIDRCIN